MTYGVTVNDRLAFKPLARLEENPRTRRILTRAADVKRLYKHAGKKGTGRPRESAEGAQKKSISLPRALWRKLTIAANERNMSLSALIRRACKRELRAPLKTKDMFPMRFP